jgi:predicted AlkP superfamily pyrophosphatase or phosphodiesterase
MSRSVILLSVPGLRNQDLPSMPQLSELVVERATLVPSFPCVTWPVQANMLTGKLPQDHGVIANGFYWRDRRQVEMWTAGNEVIEAPQIWDRLHERDPSLTSAAWFPMLSKRSGADYVCMPAPVHNPDGSESLWCYTKPESLYGELLEPLGHFPLQHFWGPLASIASSTWIVQSAAIAARKYQPRFFYVYLPHLDYAAQKYGPNSPEAIAALRELDNVVGLLVDGFREAYAPTELLWLAASEYVINDVNHVVYPNRQLRELGLLQVRQEEDGEHLDLAASRAWALADHQMAHVFLRDTDPQLIGQIATAFRTCPGIAEVLVGPDRQRYGLGHPRSGEVILVSEPSSWQAYYWWEHDQLAPAFARTVDIHRKPGYDPAELHFDFATKQTPLDATLVRGSHGAPATSDDRCGILTASAAGILSDSRLRDTDLAPIVLKQFPS